MSKFINGLNQGIANLVQPCLSEKSEMVFVPSPSWEWVPWTTKPRENLPKQELHKIGTEELRRKGKAHWITTAV